MLGLVNGGHTPISFTRFTASDPATLSKKVWLDGQHSIQKGGGGSLVDGVAETLVLPGPMAFAEVLAKLEPNQALAYGVNGHDAVRVVSRGRMAELPKGTEAITRTRENFMLPAGQPGILFLDYDPPGGSAPTDQDDVLAALYEIAPYLRNAPIVCYPSAGSCIVDTEIGKELRGVVGLHLYLFVADASDIPRALKVMCERSWLRDHGRYEISNAGTLLERALFDHHVAQPERLDFAAGAVCTPPLVQNRPSPEIINPEAAPVDTRAAFLDLTPEEKKQIAGLKAKAKAATKPEADKVRAAYIAKRIETEVKENPEANREVLAQRWRAALENHRLLADFVVEIQDIGSISVGELLDDPSTYHGKRCADPLEPDYRADDRVGYINLRVPGRPYIYSHAHGGIRYSLHRVLQTVQLLDGELHETVYRVLEVIRLDGQVFDHGGELAYIAAGRIYPVTPEWLTVYLTGLLSLEKWDGNKKDFRSTNCPLGLAKAVMALRGQWRLPELRVVIAAPIMLPNGRILEDEGYDHDSKLCLVYEDPEQKCSVPREPTIGEVRRAVVELWYPFKDFPFVGTSDIGVMLAALLTAVLRPVLDTAPGFLFDAPTAGSGKTKLASCIAILAGMEQPALMPPVKNEEELRKRLLAVLREGAPAMVFDNVVDGIDSPALASFMTSRVWTDRLLGQSENVSLPNTTLIMATGNNISVLGDLCRRFLKCRIDPKMETPYRRAFDLEPERYVRENRLPLVVAALTILRGAQVHCAGYSLDRTASYEDWSDTVRRAVIFVRNLVALPVEDPIQTVEAAYEEDPDKTKLRGLVTIWYERFEDQPVTVSELCSAAISIPVQGTEKFVGPGAPVDSALLDVLLEIAGERNEVNKHRLGKWLKRHVEEQANGLRIVAAGDKHGSKIWRVEKIPRQ